jgi:hypothetical protein
MSLDLRQCYDCGGVTTHGTDIGISEPTADGTYRGYTAWSCLWCIDGREGWPRVGSWRIAIADDRTYPEGRWSDLPYAERKAHGHACVARGCVPPPEPA